MDFWRLETCLAMRPCECNVCGIATGRDPDDAVNRTHPASIEGKPLTAFGSIQVSLENCVEVLRAQPISIDTGITCRNPNSAAQRNAEVRKITTNALLTMEDLCRRGIWAGAAALIRDMRKNPIAYRSDARVSLPVIAKVCVREIGGCIRRAISAWSQILEILKRQV